MPPRESQVTIRALGGDPEEMAMLQRVLEAAPTYAHLVTGCPPGAADAQSTYSILPEGKSYDDKFVFGVYRGTQMVGCADVIRGFPEPSTAHLGLLLVAEPLHRQGIGAAAYRALEAFIRAWQTCSRVRVGIVRTNERVLPFWLKMGFALSGEVKPYHYGNVISEAVILVKPLPPTAT